MAEKTQEDGKPEQSSGEELENRAKELGTLTKSQGMGQRFGYQRPIDKNIRYDGFYPGKGFILGDEVINDEREYYKLLELIVPVYGRDPICDSKQTQRQLLLINKYKPPVRKWRTEAGGLFRKRYEEHEEPITFHGKHGEEDWIQFTYFMYIQHHRPGTTIELNVAVPPDLAKQIESAIQDHPYFPDRYFKALFPGMFGEDKRVSLTRHPATELLVVDRRENPQNTAGELRQYPQPIPY